MPQLKWANEKRLISDLRPAEYNPRKINKKQAKDLSTSLHRFDLADPIIINSDNKIIGGHQRFHVLSKNGGKEVDVRVPSRQLSLAEERELNLRLNKNLGEWDLDMLANFEEAELLEAGFEVAELDRIFDLSPNEKEDAVPALKETDIKHGDVFKLGSHRIMCGDSCNAVDVETLMRGKKPVLVVTDPPYGVNYDPCWREGQDLGVGERSKGKVKNDDKFDWSDALRLFDAQVMYVWHCDKFSHVVAEGLIKCGYKIVCEIVWIKQHFVVSRGDYHWKHEPCWYVVKNGEKHNWQGSRKETTVWEVANNNSFGNPEKEKTWGHGTQKPVELFERAVRNNASRDDLVCDPFLGTGTAVIACEKTKRACYGMELDPQYCQIVIDRWEQFTNQKAVKIDG
jgi:DNA modification methylase